MQNQVEMIDCYGSDERHALSAWTSTSRELTDEKRARIPKMLKFLAENKHYTPFEKSFISFLVTADTASHIHIIKHRIGVSVNAESARYKELQDDKYYVPDDWPEWMQDDLTSYIEDGLLRYHETLEQFKEPDGTYGEIDRKRAKESARYYLPYANQLVLDVSFNFKSFMHFQLLRNDPHAQREIRLIAAQMLEQVSDAGNFKYSLEAFGY